jgi:nitrite reductase (NADH) small subunit
MISQSQDPEFVAVAKVTDIAPGEGKMVRAMSGRLRAKPIAVFNENGNFYALNYVCVHMGGPLSEGVIKDGEVTCPWHGWSFVAGTGLPGRTGGHPTVAYELKVEGDDILLGWIKQPNA